MAYETQLRATFNDTKKNQEKLRVKLDHIDFVNEYVNPNDRSEFFELLSDALLGFDYDKKVRLRMPDVHMYTLKTLENSSDDLFIMKTLK